MIINEFEEEEQNKNMKNNISINMEDDKQVQRIKAHLDERYLQYVSENVRLLLKINIENNKCFEKNSNWNRIKGQGDKYRVILYIRLSVEDGDVIDGDVSKSIRNQLLILLDECEKRNWIVVGIFCEEGISGADDNRPEWNKSLKFCELRKYRNSSMQKSIKIFKKYGND